MENNKLLSETEKAVEVLQRLVGDGANMAALPKDLREALMTAAGRLTHPNRDQLRLRNKQIQKARKQKLSTLDRQARNATQIRQARQNSVYEAPRQIAGQVSIPNRKLNKARHCYVCKKEFHELHHFYDSMCAECGDFNYKKRYQTANLTGQVALITGSRLKIGYQSALLMLRSGARVIATTRFPVDAAARFAREKDYEQWAGRLSVFGLDLRHIPSVERFCGYLNQTLDRLDILVNNAAQTVRRPPAFYAHLLEAERTPQLLTQDARLLLKSFENHKALLPSVEGFSYDRALSTEDLFPNGKLDADLQQVDLRTVNSWRLGLADVPTPELLEVQLVNSIAPFVLCSRLAPLMRRHNTGCKHIVNVSAMEGKFSRYTKTDKHPHTNMAKAALNMLTLTSAPDLAKDGIYMNAVDTGWVTDEDPVHLSKAKQEMHDFQPPLDIVDGAARVCDPFLDGINTGKHWCGKFLKDYFPTDW